MSFAPALRRSALLALAVLATACATCPPAPVEHRSAELELLFSWMEGSFSSAEQAAADPDFRDIRLHMAAIWPQRSDALWLYVEQAVAEAQDRPYRQRVYRVSQIADDLFESRVYAFAEPLRFAGAWTEPDRLDELAPEDLEERAGCAILLRFTGNAFAGSTLGRLCSSELRGASYATSEVRIDADGLLSWDRGFDAEGHQVWGAEKGGYLFRRAEKAQHTP